MDRDRKFILNIEFYLQIVIVGTSHRKLLNTFYVENSSFVFVSNSFFNMVENIKFQDIVKPSINLDYLKLPFKYSYSLRSISTTAPL